MREGSVAALVDTWISLIERFSATNLNIAQKAFDAMIGFIGVRILLTILIYCLGGLHS
jgi:hypothetical protein